MRLGKAERKAVKLIKAQRDAAKERAALVQDHGGKYASSCTRLNRHDFIVQGGKKWDYNGYTSRRIARNGRIVT